MSIRKAVITAAGFGSRFLPITKTIPKEMLPVGDKPIIHYIVQECADAGIEEIIIVAAPDEVKIFEDYFYGHAEHIKQLMYRQGKIDRWKKVAEIFSFPLVTVIPEDRTIPYGNGRPILTAKYLVEKDEAFVACFGDDLVLTKKEGAVGQIMAKYEETKADAIMATQIMPKEHLVKGGVVKLKQGSEDKVEFVVEKPSLEELPSDLYSYGRFVLTNKIFDYLDPQATGKDGEVWLQDANDKLAHAGDVRVCRVDGEFYTTGDPENLLKAQNAYWAAK